MTSLTVPIRRRFAVPPGLLRHAGLLAVLLFVSTCIGLMSDVFLTAPNLLNILRQVSVVAVLAAGLTLLMTAGGIDFSLGSQAAVVHAVTAQLLVSGTPVPTAVAVGLLVGLGVGLINGLIITLFGIAPFVVTLATATALDGVALIVMNGQSISIGTALSPLAGNVFGIPVLLMIATVVCVLVAVTLRWTRFGRAAFAIGGNSATARLSGIPVQWFTVSIYTLNGLLAGLAGVMLLARLGAASPGTGGLYLELTVVAAVVIGGTALHGGNGTLVGTVLGVLLLGILANGINLLQISSFYQPVSVGLVLLVASIANQLRRYRT